MPWQVEFNAGVWLPEVGWWLDAHYARPRSFVSHAHFDHLAAHGEVLCSAGTSRLMQARLPAKRIEHVLPFGQTERLDPSTVVTLYPAGHIHGSAQCLLEHERLGSLLYTGDFKLRPGRSAEICATPRADTVIMETTFGRPQYVFPPTERVLGDIAAFCHAALADGEVPVLFGYSLGKSQELLSGLTDARLPVMLHPQTHRLTRIYEELGIAFPPHRAFDAAESPGHVVICPGSEQVCRLRKMSASSARIAQRSWVSVPQWSALKGGVLKNWLRGFKLVMMRIFCESAFFLRKMSTQNFVAKVCSGVRSVKTPRSLYSCIVGNRVRSNGLLWLGWGCL